MSDTRQSLIRVTQQRFNEFLKMYEALPKANREVERTSRTTRFYLDGEQVASRSHRHYFLTLGGEEIADGLWQQRFDDQYVLVTPGEFEDFMEGLDIITKVDGRYTNYVHRESMTGEESIIARIDRISGVHQLDPSWRPKPDHNVVNQNALEALQQIALMTERIGAPSFIASMIKLFSQQRLMLSEDIEHEFDPLIESMFEELTANVGLMNAAQMISSD